MMNATMIKVLIPIHGDYDVYYFKPKSKKIEVNKYVDTLYYYIGDENHKVGYKFVEFLLEYFDKAYTKDELSNARVEFITEVEVKEIDF